MAYTADGYAFMKAWDTAEDMSFISTFSNSHMEAGAVSNGGMTSPCRSHSEDSFVDIYEGLPDRNERTRRLSSSVGDCIGEDVLSDSNHERAERLTNAMKNRMKGWWANMLYGWNAIKAGTQIDISDLDGSEPIYLLGQVYHNRNSPSSFRNFFSDFSTRIWFTYRQDFEPITSSGHTSDSGWGCMLRSAQMLLAQAFVCHLLGRDWRWNPKSGEPSLHSEIVSWFSDESDMRKAPFSIHSMIKGASETFGRKAGDWFGPQMASYILKNCIAQASIDGNAKEIFQRIAIYIAQDCTVYIGDVLEMCTDKETNGWKSVIILVPVRLGEDSINTEYVHCIREMLAQPNCIGIIGGKPRHSLYFIGFQGTKLLYLDPHYLQKSHDVFSSPKRLQNFHCTLARKVSFSKLDPSATIGFYCKTREDFEKFARTVRDTNLTHSGPNNYPVFMTDDGKSSLQKSELNEVPENIQSLDEIEESNVQLKSDEFVIL